MLLEDFTHHNIEMACSLLEVCGRFLYRSEDSHIRTKNLLVSCPEKHIIYSANQYDKNKKLCDRRYVFGENQLDVRQINRNPFGNYPCDVTYCMSGCNIIY